MSPIDIALVLLVIQGALGAFDVFYNHEWDARLPSRESAILELRIHSIRAIIYAVIFYGIAWYLWYGLLGWLLISLIVVEIGLTLWDFVVEDRTRNLSATERITHTVLAMNGGAYVAFICYEIAVTWIHEETKFEAVDYGAISWILTIYAIGVFVSGVRDGLSSATLTRSRSEAQTG